MTHRSFTIGLIQMRVSNDPTDSLKHAIAMLEEAASKGVQVACLPELFLNPYFCQREDTAIFDLAEAVPGPTTKALAEVAKRTRMTIVGSVFERRAAGVYHNTAAVLDADGNLAGVYRKMHIPDDPLFYEKYYFTPGDLGFKAFDTAYARVGTLVCWDQWYPEAARLTAMQGADVLFYPTAIGWHPKEKAEYGVAQAEAWETIQRSHAIANGIYVASVNRIGQEWGIGPQGAKDEGLEFWGGSFIADPYGRILAKASPDKEEIITATVDTRLIEDKRRNWPHFRDRRIDAYGDLLNRWNG